ncbi:MAG: ribonuclease P protein component [Bacteroidota bacterium]
MTCRLITIRATFKQEERLKSRKRIEELFKEGKAVNLPPLRLLYLPCDELPNHQVLFTVSKKRFKRAVTRNKLKRRMREAYRLNKHLLTPRKDIHFLIGYIYIASHKPCSFKKIQEKLIGSFQLLNQLHASNNHDPIQT